MKTQVNYNLNKLIKTRVSDYIKTTLFEYREPITIFGKVIKKAGIYNIFDSEVELPKEYIIKDNIVYEKPSVILFFEDNIKYEKHFETYEDALKFEDLIIKASNQNFWQPN